MLVKLTPVDIFQIFILQILIKCLLYLNAFRIQTYFDVLKILKVYTSLLYWLHLE